jgi:hypothetical protein
MRATGRLPLSIAGFCLLVVLGTVIFLTHASPVEARPGINSPLPIKTADDADCLACHSEPGQTTTLPNGDSLYISIDSQAFDASVHGGKKLSCTTCHTDITGYPHPPVSASSLREFTLLFQNTCQDCHLNESLQYQDSVHHAVFANGNANAPTCVDCHNPHNQTSLRDAQGNLKPEVRVAIPQTCARCHNEIYNEYAQSVHGVALLTQDNPDVPTCTDCHGVHQIIDPTTTAFRLGSVQLCASCHTNKSIMAKYGISTSVLSTYVADFHGTTVTLFQKLSPGQETNKPVCFDCHGVHNIVAPNDPARGMQIKQNILTTCQRCHPDATTNFPDAWLSHYIPDPQHYPLVYYVNLFYKIFIPLVIGSMALFVLSDIIRRRIDRRKKSALAKE